MVELLTRVARVLFQPYIFILETMKQILSQWIFFSTSLKINMFIVGWFPLQWNISDFFYQNRQRIESELTAAQSREPGSDVLGGEVPPFDALWMSLYVKQGELCVDQRPAVRKSAGQTLFSTISAHGGLLQTNTWKKVVWQVSERIRSRSLHVQQSFVMIYFHQISLKEVNILC